ncbi:hypothetical protein B4113_1682 [Geobacillus sp. B4113_201601]|nr:hypothetical protein B4113_1682 [Geobacillus sp. B4113_201601]
MIHREQWCAYEYCFYRTYEGLKHTYALATVFFSMRFYRTYEGLKRPYSVTSCNFFLQVFIVPTRD